MPFTAYVEDEEEAIGYQRSESRPLLSPAASSFSHRSQDAPRGSPSKLRSAMNHLRPVRAGLKRRPTAVRIMEPNENQGQRFGYSHDGPPLHDVNKATTNLGERTPLIKSGVKPDIRRTAEDVAKSMQVEVGLGRMVELGLPLIMSVQRLWYMVKLMNRSHEISRSIFKFRRMGCLEAVGPAVRDRSTLVYSY
jgi:putative membrane protein